MSTQLIPVTKTGPPSKKEDPVIVLKLSDGKMYFHHRSTLMNCGSDYFANRLRGSWGSEFDFKDGNGFDVMVVPRSSYYFDHINDYIISLRCRVAFQDMPMTLRRRLRHEANFFGMDDLLDKLKLSFSPDTCLDGKGVLYWLGTAKGTQPYQNPCEIGAVEVKKSGGKGEDTKGVNDVLSYQDLCNFVEHRPQVILSFERQIVPEEQPEIAPNARKEFEHYTFQVRCPNPFGCDYSPDNPDSPEVNLKDITLKPTHYSLRTSMCGGMWNDWNLEASVDGKDGTWDKLHMARNDRSLRMEFDIADDLNNTVRRVCGWPCDSKDAIRNAVMMQLERRWRHTWKLDPPPSKHYQYFRIIRVYENFGDDTPPECFHCEGLELFGEVHDKLDD